MSSSESRACRKAQRPNLAPPEFTGRLSVKFPERAADGPFGLSRLGPRDNRQDYLLAAIRVLQDNISTIQVRLNDDIVNSEREPDDFLLRVRVNRMAKALKLLE